MTAYQQHQQRAHACADWPTVEKYLQDIAHDSSITDAQREALKEIACRAALEAQANKHI